MNGKSFKPNWRWFFAGWGIAAVIFAIAYDWPPWHGPWSWPFPSVWWGYILAVLTGLVPALLLFYLLVYRALARIAQKMKDGKPLTPSEARAVAKLHRIPTHMPPPGEM